MDTEIISPAGMEPFTVPDTLVETIAWECTKVGAQPIASRGDLSDSEKLAVIFALAISWLKVISTTMGAQRSHLEAQRFAVAASSRLKYARSKEEIEYWHTKFSEKDMKEFAHVAGVLEDLHEFDSKQVMAIDEFAPGLFRYIPIQNDAS